MNKLLIVESPSKASTIKKILKGEYNVLASYGHIRDLSQKDGIKVVNGDVVFNWEIDPKKKDAINELVKQASKASSVILATDPDREGEAIAWHINSILAENNVVQTSIKRAVFHEITTKAVTAAVNNTRNLDTNLVEAYFARRALDYLFGFQISPVLWKKLPSAKSAGRVQSSALRLIIEREIELFNFRPIKYWDVNIKLVTDSGNEYIVSLKLIDNKKIQEPGIADYSIVEKTIKDLSGSFMIVTDKFDENIYRHAPAPFITSSLQQAAHNSLGYSANRTMKLAQSLYEGISIDGKNFGLITYMRTDNVGMADDAINSVRNFIEQKFGQDYLYKSIRIHKNKVKNAQEAHECIRPVDISITPEMLKGKVDEGLEQVYRLIWNRTVASQMSDMVSKKYSLEFSHDGYQAVLTAIELVFDGFEKIYVEEEEEKKDKSFYLRKEMEKLRVDEKLAVVELLVDGKLTTPPRRYTEASLIKTLEKHGIGRPSTYANVMSILINRDYIELYKKSIMAKDNGYLLVLFLIHWFASYVEYNFTAEMEDKLDMISCGEVGWKGIILQFYNELRAAVNNIESVQRSGIIDLLNKLMIENHNNISFACNNCGNGTLSVKLSRAGSFIGCSNYPNCGYTSKLFEFLSSFSTTTEPEKKLRGIVSELKNATNKETINDNVKLVFLNNGKCYGISEESDFKYIELSQFLSPEGNLTINHDDILDIMSCPKSLGMIDGEELSLKVGKFGPFLAKGKTSRSLKSIEKWWKMDLENAIKIIAEPKKTRKVKV